MGPNQLGHGYADKEIKRVDLWKNIEAKDKRAADDKQSKQRKKDECLFIKKISTPTSIRVNMFLSIFKKLFYIHR
jgi:hypothetical protein